MHSVNRNMSSKSKTNFFYTLVTGTLISLIFFERFFTSIFFGNSDSNSSPIDEIAVLLLFLLSVGLVIFRSRLFVGMLRNIFVFAIYLVTVSLAFGVNQGVIQVISQVFLHFQFFLVFFSLIVLYVNRFLDPNLVFRTFIGITIIGAISQLLVPEIFASIFGSTTYSESSGLERVLRLEGLQQNPNALGSAFAMYAVMLMFTEKSLYTIKNARLVLLGILVLLALTGSRSALMYVLAAYLCLPTNPLRKTAIILAGVSILYLSGDLEFIIEKTLFNISLTLDAGGRVEYVRWTLLRTGFELAAEYFPFGTGAATFGSAFSFDSPIYRETGLSTIYAFASLKNIHDSNIATLLGEFGFIGFIAFTALFLHITKSALQHFSSKDQDTLRGGVQNKRFLIVLFCIMFVTIFLRAFYSSSYYSIIFCLFYLCYIDRWFNHMPRASRRKEKSRR